MSFALHLLDCSLYTYGGSRLVEEIVCTSLRSVKTPHRTEARLQSVLGRRFDNKASSSPFAALARRWYSDSTSAPATSPSSTSNARHQWDYVVAASCHGKTAPQGPEASQRRGLLQGFSKDAPVGKWREETLARFQHAKISPGQDFLCVERMKDGSGTALAIADGVGGWEDQGVDSAVFAQALMYYASRAAQRLPVDGEDTEDGAPLDSGASSSTSDSGYFSSQPQQDVGDPMLIMHEAYKDVLEDGDVKAGGSTACVVTLNSRSGKLKAANLGDSTFAIFRSSKMIHFQPSQTHFFNCPKQLSKVPWKMGPDDISDKPSDADVYECNLRHGDLVLLATDGVTDNVWPQELEQLVQLVLSKEMRGDASDATLLQKLANTMVAYARICSFKEDKETPFEVEARRCGVNYKGGKVDDVTCVLAMCLER